MNWEALRIVIRDALGWPDDYVVIDGSSEPVVVPQSYGGDLLGICTISARKASGVGSLVDKVTTTEMIGGKEYRVVTHKRHTAWYVDVLIRHFDVAAYAGDVARSLADTLEFEGTLAALSAADISLARVYDTRDVPFAVDNSTLSAAVTELLLYAPSEVVDNTAREIIETITIEGDPTP